MKIRVIQLINNYFRDENCINEDKEKALGLYCAFGYFDAVQIEEGNEIPNIENPIWKNIEEVAVHTLDGIHSRRNLICIAEDKEKDTAFWEKAVNYPYLFISLIRMRHNCNDANTMNQVVNEIKSNDTCIAYYSYNHSELVIAKIDKNYSQGMGYVLSLREKLNPLNMYSIFSAREDIIKSETKLQSKADMEEVSVQLRLMIKNDHEITGFLQKLWNALFEDKIQKKQMPEKENFEKFYTLGSSDMMVRIEQVEMHKLLSCYSMGRLLTHTNDQFGKAVYNIETEILVRGEHLKHGKSVDTRKVSEAEAIA